MAEVFCVSFRVEDWRGVKAGVAKWYVQGSRAFVYRTGERGALGQHSLRVYRAGQGLCWLASFQRFERQVRVGVRRLFKGRGSGTPARCDATAVNRRWLYRPLKRFHFARAAKDAVENREGGGDWVSTDIPCRVGYVIPLFLQYLRGVVLCGPFPIDRAWLASFNFRLQRHGLAVRCTIR